MADEARANPWLQKGYGIAGHASECALHLVRYSFHTNMLSKAESGGSADMLACTVRHSGHV